MGKKNTLVFALKVFLKKKINWISTCLPFKFIYCFVLIEWINKAAYIYIYIYILPYVLHIYFLIFWKLYLSIIGYLCNTTYNIDCNIQMYSLHLCNLFYAFQYFFFVKGSVRLTRLSKGSMTQERLRTPALDGEQGAFIQQHDGISMNIKIYHLMTFVLTVSWCRLHSQLRKINTESKGKGTP
jgi:hypothetical protein